MRLVVLLATACTPGTGSVVGAPPPSTPATGTPPTPTPTTAWTPSTPPGPPPDFSALGPHAVATSTGTLSASCDMPYTVFVPVGHEPAALVVLAHGYLRTEAPMRGHGERLASHGLAVVTPDLCSLELFDLDFDDNADDLVALGVELGKGGPIVHAGHSFGALSSFVAASRDPMAVGHVGLDLVDELGLGLDVAPTLTVPAWGTLGEPEWCNQEGNGHDVYPLVAEARLVEVVGADHCDFEDPSDVGCAGPCASGSGDDEVVTRAIAALTTAAALALSGSDPRGAEYWTPGGAAHDAMVDAGMIRDLR